jgi:hypothetical protein
MHLPTVEHLRNLFRRGTWWWKTLSKECIRGGSEWLSRPARLLLVAATGKSLRSVKELPTRDLLKMPLRPQGLSKVRNFILTLDGILISLLLSATRQVDGKKVEIEEMNNWQYFDKVMQSYFKEAIFDLFKVEGPTYYAELKRVRGLIKDLALKERRTFEEEDLPQRFWYFKYIVKYHIGGRKILSLDSLRVVTFITQTRACGLPPAAVKTAALEKFLATVTSKCGEKSPRCWEDLSYGVDRVALDIVTGKDFNMVLNRSLAESKISASNSACIQATREEGGKVEALRVLYQCLKGQKIPVFDLRTGRVSHYVEAHDGPLSIGETLFHHSIYEWMRFIKSNYRCKDLGGQFTLADVRVDLVTEPGKARVITIPHVLHGVLLQPLAHVFSVLVASLPSSTTGMKASNHMWDFYKRMSPLVPVNDIFGHDKHPGRETYLCSEDWSEATDRFDPLVANFLVKEFGRHMGLPRFYIELCARAISVPRRLFLGRDPSNGDLREPAGTKVLGCLMGDPLTKQILHLSHNVVRKIAENYVLMVCHKVHHGFPVYKANSSPYTYRPFPIKCAGATEEWARGWLQQERADTVSAGMQRVFQQLSFANKIAKANHGTPDLSGGP